MKFLRCKKVSTFQNESEGRPVLRRELGPINLILLGAGRTIGAGIFVLAGKAAAENAGPAVILALSDDSTPVDDLGKVACLAGDRPAPLFLFWHPAQQTGEGAGLKFAAANRFPGENEGGGRFAD